MDWNARIESYTRLTGFPRSLFVAGDGRVVGTWIMGNDYRVKSGYYGGYPAGYLRRIAALVQDRKRPRTTPRPRSTTRSPMAGSRALAGRRSRLCAVTPKISR